MSLLVPDERMGHTVRISVNITDFQKTMSCITGLKVWNRKITGKEGSEARYLMP